MKPSRWLTAFHLLLIFAAFALAGGVDMREAERLSDKGYVEAHHEFTRAAPGVGEVEDYGRARFPKLAVEECR